MVAKAFGLSRALSVPKGKLNTVSRVKLAA
jgi:hypothetical protein